MEKVIVKNFDLNELREYFETIGEKKFRADQVFNWIYNNNISSYHDMLNISKSLRTKLVEETILNVLEVVSLQDSGTGTKKMLLKTHDDKFIESVIIPDEDRRTLCISTQVGCPLDCKFCATGQMGYYRNLSAAEIIEQYLIAERNCDKNITNIVYMGMGEPLVNFDATLKSLKIFTAEEARGLSRQRITVSTSGFPHKIAELAESGLRVKLAFSLHSCFEDIRSEIMPINKKYSLRENVAALKHYAQATGTRITFEYTMLKDINDRNEDIRAIVKLCNSIPSKINIIPYNSIEHTNPDGFSADLKPTPTERIEEFANQLRNRNITVMLRDTRGDDISAACGQLAVKNIKD